LFLGNEVAQGRWYRGPVRKFFFSNTANNFPFIYSQKSFSQASLQMKKHKGGGVEAQLGDFFLTTFSNTLFDPEAEFFTVGTKLLVYINEFHC
jgi:hypothetical protein